MLQNVSKNYDVKEEKINYREIVNRIFKVQNIIINHSFLPKIVYTVMLLLTIFLTLITELNYFNDGKFVYSYGKATDIVFTPCIISFLIGSISIIINRKHINFQVMIKNQKNIIFALSMNFQLLKKLLNICH